jgi:glycosyltransferase involved in cell wall biosynthesis
MGQMVEVLLSTYGGEAFVEEQCRSVLSQSWRNLRLVIRDDGSRDHTPRLLHRIAADHRVELRFGANLGPTRSFLALLQRVRPETGFAAFCDQDDVWFPDKVERAVASLARLPEGTPGLYCSCARLTDGALRPIGFTPCCPRPPSFGNALVENVAMGCTTVLNRAAIELLQSVRAARGIICHDWWCYLVVSAFGVVLFDPQPSLDYRQHGRNLIGAQASLTRRLFARVKRQWTRNSLGLMLRQVSVFSRLYGSRLGAAEAELLRGLLERRRLANRLALVRSGAVFRQTRLDDFLLRACLLTWG